MNASSRCADSCFTTVVESDPLKHFFKILKGSASTSEAPLTGPSRGGGCGLAEPCRSSRARGAANTKTPLNAVQAAQRSSWWTVHSLFTTSLISSALLTPVLITESNMDTAQTWGLPKCQQFMNEKSKLCIEEKVIKTTSTYSDGMLVMTNVLVGYGCQKRRNKKQSKI